MKKLKQLTAAAGDAVLIVVLVAGFAVSAAWERLHGRRGGVWFAARQGRT